MRLYDAGRNAAKGIWRNHAAVLDCAAQDDQTGFSGGLDRAVRMYVPIIGWGVYLRSLVVGVMMHARMRPLYVLTHPIPYPFAPHGITGSTWTGRRTPA